MKWSRDPTYTGGVGDPETTDLDRRSADGGKFGQIKEVDYKAKPPKYRVLIGDAADEDNQIITDWLPAAGGRAKGDVETHLLEVGEKVFLLAEGGELATAHVIPTGTYTTNPDEQAAADRPGVWRRRFKNGAVVGYDRDTGELTLDATNSIGKVTMRSKDSVIRMSDGKMTVQTGAKAQSTGPSNDGKTGAQDPAPGGSGDADTFDLNSQMKGLHARIEQAEHANAAHHFVNSMLWNLLLPTNPQIQGLQDFYDGKPEGLEKMIGVVEGELPQYAQKLLTLAQGKFTMPTLSGIANALGGLLQGQIAALQAKIMSITAELAGMSEEDRQNSPLAGVMKNLQAQLSGLMTSSPLSGDFIGPQVNITKGMIESVRFGGPGKQS